GAVGVVTRAAPAGRERVIIERERTVVAGEELVDDPLHLSVAQRRIVASDDRHERGAHRISISAARVASITRQTRALPRTSCTRTIRQPLMTPYATVVSDSGPRSPMSRP